MGMTYDDSLAKLLDNFETPKTLAFEHALDISWNVYSEMKRRGIKNKDLAKKLDVSEARVSQILNMQPNLTLETIAALELALDIRFGFELVSQEYSNTTQSQSTLLCAATNLSLSEEPDFSDTAGQEPTDKSGPERKMAA